MLQACEGGVNGLLARENMIPEVFGGLDLLNVATVGTA